MDRSTNPLAGKTSQTYFVFSCLPGVQSYLDRVSYYTGIPAEINLCPEMLKCFIQNSIKENI